MCFHGRYDSVIALLITTMTRVIKVLLLGFITSGRNIGFEPYLLDIAPNEKRTIYLGIRGSLNILVVLLPLAGGIFINILGYYITFGLVSLIMLLVFLSIKK
jgi:hypothetical protein